SVFQWTRLLAMALAAAARRRADRPALRARGGAGGVRGATAKPRRRGRRRGAERAGAADRGIVARRSAAAAAAGHDRARSGQHQLLHGGAATTRLAVAGAADAVDGELRSAPPLLSDARADEAAAAGRVL